VSKYVRVRRREFGRVRAHVRLGVRIYNIPDYWYHLQSRVTQVRQITQTTQVRQITETKRYAHGTVGCIFPRTSYTHASTRFVLRSCRGISRAFACVFAVVCTCVYLRACLCACVRACVRALICACVCECACARTCLHACVCTCACASYEPKTSEKKRQTNKQGVTLLRARYAQNFCRRVYPRLPATPDYSGSQGSRLLTGDGHLGNQSHQSLEGGGRGGGGEDSADREGGRRVGMRGGSGSGVQEDQNLAVQEHLEETANDVMECIQAIHHNRRYVGVCVYFSLVCVSLSLALSHLHACARVRARACPALSLSFSSLFLSFSFALSVSVPVSQLLSQLLSVCVSLVSLYCHFYHSPDLDLEPFSILHVICFGD